MAFEQWYLDVILAPLSLISLVAYHAYFFLEHHRNPNSTVLGESHVNRRSWVRAMMRDDVKYGHLAVQTTRNYIMGQTLLASASMSAATAVASFFTTTTAKSLYSSLSPLVYGSKSELAVAGKCLCLLICLVTSFLCFVQAIRYTNYVNFIICIPMSSSVPGLSPEYVSSVFARGNNFFAAGMRALLFGILCAVYIFGPIPMIVATMAFLFLFPRIDFVQQPKERALGSEAVPMLPNEAGGTMRGVQVGSGGPHEA
eukprot:TRINITY_DN26403_c0_g1_i1.p1 TRINITY_DN26403_c0_g1~~TRINITY_DN26403_c0_g1_i1.p1  ORF type:complete len:256 (-),score=24.04 TRINITY_DN26403_c0_g1_i1:747-1514(-)